MKLEFSREIFGKYSSKHFHENCSLGAELFHADGRKDGLSDRHTDTRKAIVALRNFAKAPKNDYTKQLMVVHQKTHSAALREIQRPYTIVVTTEFSAAADL
jgi:hypothetical protein